MAKEHEVTRREFLRLAGVAGGVIGLGGGLGGILAACGGGTTTTTGGAATTAGSTPTTAGAVTTAATALVAPKKGGSLVIVTPDEGSGVIGIPWQMQSPQGSTASSCVDTLVKVTWDGTVEPNLATSWEIAADGTSIIIPMSISRSNGMPSLSRDSAARSSICLASMISSIPEIIGNMILTFPNADALRMALN